MIAGASPLSGLAQSVIDVPTMRSDCSAAVAQGLYLGGHTGHREIPGGPHPHLQPPEPEVAPTTK